MASPTRRELIGAALALACGVRTAVAGAGDELLDAPLARDSADRLLLPVYVNGHGPYRFMLDSGASHCAVPRDLARRLALPSARASSMSIVGTTGRSSASGVDVQSLEIGALRIESLSMPVIAAQQGIIGVNALGDTRLDVNFDTRRISLRRATSRLDGEALSTVSVQRRFGGLLLATGTFGDLACSFIIDTGAQRSIGNPALARRVSVRANSPAADPLVVVTPDASIASLATLPVFPVVIGAGDAVDLGVACADLPVFALWQLADRPAILLGMDYFSRLARFVIDFRHSTLGQGWGRKAGEPTSTAPVS